MTDDDLIVVDEESLIQVFQYNDDDEEPDNLDTVKGQSKLNNIKTENNNDPQFDEDIPGYISIMCEICQEVLTSVVFEQHMQQHIQANNEETNTSKDILQSSQQHSKRQDFKCKTSELREHEKQHTENSSHFCFKCSKCDYKIDNQSDLLMHLRKNHNMYNIDEVNDKQICKYCFKFYANKSGLANHIKKMHLTKNQLSKYRCNNCNVGFRLLYEMQMHQANCTSSSFVECKHACKYCSMTFKSKYFLTQHVQKNHTNLIQHNFECNVCKLHFTRLQQLELHKQSGICEATLLGQDKNIGILQQQQQENNKEDIENSCNNEHSYICQQCQKYLSSKYSLKRHFDNVHGKRKGPPMLQSNN